MAIINGESGLSVKNELNTALTELSELRIVTLTVGTASVAAGNAGYVKSDGKIYKTDASAEATAGPVMIGIILDTADPDDACRLQIRGNYTTTGLTTGSIYYVSETAGALTTTAPTATDSVINALGYASSTTNFVIMPGVAYVTNSIDAVSINTQTNVNAYTLVLGDASKILEMNTSAGNIVSVPSSGSVAFPTGTTIDVVQINSGLTVISSGATGVTLNGSTGITSQGQWKALSMYKRADDAWTVLGGA